MQFLICVESAVTSQVEIIMELLAAMAVLAFSNGVFDEVLSTRASVSEHAIDSKNNLCNFLQQQRMTASLTKHVAIGVHIADLINVSQWE